MDPTYRPNCWRLGDWLIEPSRNSLRPADGSAAVERTLEPRVMAVLESLLRHGSEPVSDDTLLADVWPGVAVSDASVYQAIAQLRKALGDSAKPYRYVGRVSGKGYFLVQTALVQTALVQTAEPLTENSVPANDLSDGPANTNDATEREQSPTLSVRPSVRHWSLLAAVIGIAGVLGWFGFSRDSASPASTPKLAMPLERPTFTADTDARPDSPGWDDYLQGRWLWNQRKAAQLNEAAEHFRAALKKDPQLALAYVGLCDVFHFQHLYNDWSLQKVLAQCEPLLRDALQREPQLGAALASFGLLRLSQGDLDAAESFLERAIAKNPKDAMALMWSGEVLRLRNKPEQALARMRQAEALDPLSAIIKRNLYYALASSGELIAAQHMLEEALLLEPDYADRPIDEIEGRPLTVDRAVAFIQWARRFPDRTATNNPKHGLGVQTNLAVVYLALRDFEASDHALRQAEAANPTHAYVLFIRAAWWRGNGDKQKALQLLQQRAALYPRNAFFQQVAFLQQAELDQSTDTRRAFEQRFPEARTALTPPLSAANLRLLLISLSLATQAERHALAPAVADLLQRHPLPDRLALNLRLLVGDKTAESQLRTLLETGALMSPADDYRLPEDNPLWQELNPDLIAVLNRNRQQVLQQIRR